jgi:hypothetical protein
MLVEKNLENTPVKVRLYPLKIKGQRQVGV